MSKRKPFLQGQQREQRWQQSLNDLPDDEALKAYKARWDKAQAGSVLDKLSFYSARMSISFTQDLYSAISFVLYVLYFS